jgi:hypothetical protein
VSSGRDSCSGRVDETVCLSVLFSNRRQTGKQASCSSFDNARGECSSILPELSLGRQNLPWATTTLKKSPVPKPERAARASEPASTKSAVASTTRGVGTNATARIRNAGERSTAGWRRDDRLNVASPPPSKPSMPRKRKRAVNRPSPCPRMFRSRNLRRRVVTQQNLFFPSPMRSAGLLRLVCDLVS